MSVWWFPALLVPNGICYDCKRIKSPPMFSAPEPFCVTYQHAHGRICMDLTFLNCSTDIISVGPLSWWWWLFLLWEFPGLISFLQLIFFGSSCTFSISFVYSPWENLKCFLLKLPLGLQLHLVHFFYPNQADLFIVIDSNESFTRTPSVLSLIIFM